MGVSITTRAVRPGFYASNGNVARQQPALAISLGGAAWILATLQFGVAQLVSASAWSPPYGWTTNYISDLGNTACGQFAVPHGAPTYVCSPLHAVMNASFILTGLLAIAGAVLLRQLWPQRRLTTVALALWVLTGIGKIFVGVYPENTNVDLHLLGAFNIPVESLAIMLVSLAIVRTERRVGLVGVAISLLGLGGTVLSAAGQFGAPSLQFGLGVGGMERVADYPGSLWMLMIGIIAICSSTGLRTMPAELARLRDQSAESPLRARL